MVKKSAASSNMAIEHGQSFIMLAAFISSPFIKVFHGRMHLYTILLAIWRGGYRKIWRMEGTSIDDRPLIEM